MDTVKLVKSEFCMDDDNTRVVGYTDGSYWNGWATPKFTRQAITDYLTANGWEFEFIGETLRIRFEGNDPEYFDYECKRGAYTVDGRPIDLYDVDGLCWDDVRDCAE
jgi:hypothetical protein